MKSDRTTGQRYYNSPIFQPLPRKRQPLTVGKILNSTTPSLVVGCLLGLAIIAASVQTQVIAEDNIICYSVPTYAMCFPYDDEGTHLAIHWSNPI